MLSKSSISIFSIVKSKREGTSKKNGQPYNIDYTTIACLLDDVLTVLKVNGQHDFPVGQFQCELEFEQMKTEYCNGHPIVTVFLTGKPIFKK